MKTFTLPDPSAPFTPLIDAVKFGENVAIAAGKPEQIVAIMIPYETWKKAQKRTLGTLANQASVEFSDDWQITDEELCRI